MAKAKHECRRRQMCKAEIGVSKMKVFRTTILRRTIFTAITTAAAASSNTNNDSSDSTYKFHLPQIISAFPIAQCNSNNRHSIDRNYNNSIPLSRNFIADAASIASPSVVNVFYPIDTGIASSGSGFILNKEGYVVTNAHVVNIPIARTKEVQITCWDGRKRKGIIHSIDAQSDIAIIKIVDVNYDEDIPTAIIGSSEGLRAGEIVVALGSPHFLMNSVTSGIVSATARHASELGLSRNNSEFIQTDAAINVGNSGGPLVNLDGEVIGINSMKIGGQNSSGISFAIPIDVAMIIIHQLIDTKIVKRPYIGIKMQLYSTNQRRSLRNIPIGSGSQDFIVKIVEVERNSPASRAGLQSGDTIVEINGKPVTSVKEVLNAIGIVVGKHVNVGVIRGADKSIIQYNITTESAPSY